MENVTFKKEGFWFTLYTLLYGKKNLPEDTCTYRRGLIFSVLLAISILPVTIFRLIWRGIVYLVNKFWDWNWEYTDGYPGYVAAGFMLIFPTAVGSGISSDAPELLGTLLNDLHLFYYWLIGMVFLAMTFLFFLISYSVVQGIVWLYKSIKYKYRDYMDIINYKEEEQPQSMVTVLYKSWKEKYCKKISWK